MCMSWCPQYKSRCRILYDLLFVDVLMEDSLIPHYSNPVRLMVDCTSVLILVLSDNAGYYSGFACNCIYRGY